MAVELVIHPEFAPLLQANGLREYDDFMRRPAVGPPVSPHWNRETVLLELAGAAGPRRFFLKRLFRPQPEHLLADLFHLRRPVSQPMKEWFHLRRLESADVSCMAVAAVGERRAGGLPRDGFLLGEAVPATWTVADWLELPDCVGGAPRLEEWMTRRLHFELGALARRIEDAGMRWLSLDAKHIFARPARQSARGRRWEFWIVDVERVSFSPPSAAGLSMAAAFADAIYPYSSDPRWREPGPMDWALFLGAAKGSVARPFLTALVRNRRLAEAWAVVHPNRLRPAASTGDLSEGLWLSRRGAEMLGAARLNGFESLYAFSNGAPLTKPGLQPSRRRDRLLLRSPVGVEQELFLKRYDATIGSASPGGDDEAASAAKEYRAIERLRRIGVPVPEVLAYGVEEESRGGRSLLLLSAAPGVSLERLCDEIVLGIRPAPRFVQRRRTIERLAGIVRQMHDHGLFHRDLYLCHVFWREEGGEPELTLIDLARLLRCRRHNQRWRIKDLAALDYSSPAGAVTRADRIRFLRAYFGAHHPWRLLLHRQPAGSLPVEPPCRGRLGAVVRWVAPETGRRAWDRGWLRSIRARVRRMARHDRRMGRSPDPVRSPRESDRGGAA